ncbi:MAG: 6-bladed beta-propeller, partial [Planctomycetes bacterium]|nr:6-bladed beta-propeller [Planctomycetota bacterium]
AMLLPGSVVGVAILELAVRLGLPAAIRQGWPMVAAGLVGRLGGLALLVMRLARDGRDRQLGEMAAADGASNLAAWRFVHLPRTWPIPAAAFALVVLLGLTELPATMVLLPAGLPNFAQRLLNQMHYARQQDVIASSLILVSAYMVLAGGVWVLLRCVRMRSATAMILACALALEAGGCGADGGDSHGIRSARAFGRTGRGAGEFIYPRAIDRAVDGTLFVVDKTGRIQMFDSSGNPIGGFRMPQIESGKPTGITVGPDGNLYVADTHYHRVMVFRPNGQLVRQFGRFGQGQGEFIYPTDVAIADDGRVFVSEYGGNDRVSVFDADGSFLFAFGSAGEGFGQFARPSALCIDAKRRRLYVADACNHRIVIYDLSGRRLGEFGSTGRGLGQLRYPYGLAMVDEDTLVVCEYGNNRLQLFSPDGESMGTFGAAGRQLGQLAYPWAVAVDSSRNAYVVDAGNNRIQIWPL